MRCRVECRAGAQDDAGKLWLPERSVSTGVDGSFALTASDGEPVAVTIEPPAGDRVR